MLLVLNCILLSASGMNGWVHEECLYVSVAFQHLDVVTVGGSAASIMC